MIKTITGSLLLLCALLYQVTALAASPVWRVSNGQNHIYLGGTLHYLKHTDYPLPSVFYHAYFNSDRLVLEVDTRRFKAPEYREQFRRQSLYAGNRTIASVLRPQTLNALTRFIESRQLSAPGLLRYKPGILSLQLMDNELKRLNLSAPGVDDFFREKARKDNKAIDFLEALEVQVELFTEMGRDQEDPFIQNTLSELREYSGFTEAMRKLWRNADQDRMRRYVLDNMQQRFPRLYIASLVKRNRNWLPRIEQMLKTPEVEFTLVGVLHMIGDQGLLNQLKAKGYSIEVADNNGVFTSYSGTQQ